MGYKFDEKTGEFVLDNSNEIKVKQKSSLVNFKKGGVEDRVISVIANILNIDKSKVTAGTTFRGDLNIDSLDAIELIMELEREFGISIPDERMFEMISISDVVAYITSVIK